MSAGIGDVHHETGEEVLRRQWRRHRSRLESERRGETVLVVEDEPALLGLCASYLRAAGYTVVTAASAADALVIVDAGHIRVDVLLTDIVMPGMDGRELARILSGRIPALRCILMSGYNRPTPDGAHEPCRAFIRKPFARDELVRCVDAALRPA